MNYKNIIALVFAVLFIGLSIFEIAKTPEMSSQIDDAVYLETPEIDPANEGKTVVIHGKVELTQAAYDETFGITVNAPYVSRDTREYRVRKQNGETTREWRQESAVFFTGKAKIGDYNLDEELLKGLPLKHGTVEGDFDAAEIEDYYCYQQSGIVYFSDGRLMDTDTGIYDSYPANGNGQVLFSYSVCDADKLGEVTVIGVQRGDTLKYEESFNFASVVEGVMDKAALYESQKDSAMAGVIGFGIIGLICLFFAFKGVLYLK